LGVKGSLDQEKRKKKGQKRRRRGRVGWPCAVHMTLSEEEIERESGSWEKQKETKKGLLGWLTRREKERKRKEEGGRKLSHMPCM